MKEADENMERLSSPWCVASLFAYQHFCCPECVFQVKAKQEFVDHAVSQHPDAIKYFKDIQDDSLNDVDCDWKSMEIKEEHPLQTENLPYINVDVKVETDDYFCDEPLENDPLSPNQSLETETTNKSLKVQSTKKILKVQLQKLSQEEILRHSSPKKLQSQETPKSPKFHDVKFDEKKMEIIKTIIEKKKVKNKRDCEQKKKKGREYPKQNVPSVT